MKSLAPAMGACDGSAPASAQHGARRRIRRASGDRAGSRTPSGPPSGRREGRQRRRPGPGHRDMRRRRLVAAMRHAVGALLIAAGPVAVPVRRLHELLERRRISLAEEIAGLLPAEHVAGRHAPRRAAEVAVAGEEIEEQGRVQKTPTLAFAHGENVAEQLLRLTAGQEMRLVGRALVSVARRYRHAHPEPRGEVEERGDVFRGVAVEDGHVDVDLEPRIPRLPDRGDREVEDAGLAYRPVMNLLETVKMHREEEIGRRLEQVQLFLEQQRVGAKRDKFLALDDTVDDRADLPMDEGLASGNGDDGSATFVDGVETFLNRKPLVERSE